jgi:hypothetical protein
MSRRLSYGSIVPILLALFVGCESPDAGDGAGVHALTESLDACLLEEELGPEDAYDPVSCSCLDVTGDVPDESGELVTDPCDVDSCDSDSGSGGFGGFDGGGYGGYDGGGYGGSGAYGGFGGYVGSGGYGGDGGSGGYGGRATGSGGYGAPGGGGSGGQGQILFADEIVIVVERIGSKIHVFIDGNTTPPGIPINPGDVDGNGKIVNKDLINKIVEKRNEIKRAAAPGTKIKSALRGGISLGIGTVFFLLLEGSAAAGQFAGERVNEWTAKANRGQSCAKLAAWLQKTQEGVNYACGQANCEDCYYAWIDSGVSNATLSTCINEMNADGVNTVALEAKIAEKAQSVVGQCGGKGAVEGGIRKTRKRGGYGAAANKPKFNFKPGGDPGELPGLEAVCPVDPGWSVIP